MPRMYTIDVPLSETEEFHDMPSNSEKVGCNHQVFPATGLAAFSVILCDKGLVAFSIMSTALAAEDWWALLAGAAIQACRADWGRGYKLRLDTACHCMPSLQSRQFGSE